MEADRTTADRTTAGEMAAGRVTVDGLSLDEKCRLLGGATTWRTDTLDGKVPGILMSDGPNGVRGERSGTEGVPGLVIPVGSALGATWDPALIGELGELLGREAVRRSVHLLLAPTVNIIRTPIGGRTFECYSEDPELTARLAVAFIRGVQSNSVGVTVKHFVGNDTEVDRMTVDVDIPEAALREVYLRPFEAAVLDAGAWGIMSAYNKVDGTYCAENGRLLMDILRDEWRFDGVVVSDWGGAHDTVGCADGGLTTAMPGPRTVFGEPLAEAVRSGRVDPVTVDARVGEVLRLVERTGAASLTADRAPEAVDLSEERELCRRAAAASMVLVRNERDALPLDRHVDRESRIAVIGPNASNTRIMGGGSSSLRPLPYMSILDAIRDRFGADRVEHHVGTSIGKYAPVLDAVSLRTPDGANGLLVEFRNGSDPDSPVVATARTDSSAFTSFGSVPDGVEAVDRFRVTLTGEVVPRVSGPHVVGAMMTGVGRVTVGDTVVLDDPERRLPRSDWLFGHGSIECSEVVDLVAGEAVPIRITTTGIRGLAAVRAGMAPQNPPPLIDEAVSVAGTADVSIVVVGTSDDWETEGVDRTTIALPGDQDELVRRVAEVSDRTIVIVNAGGPVAMPWIDEVDAVLIVSFAGVETGPAVAAILAGDVDPGGRLSASHPVRLEDSPAWENYAPIDGVQTYREGRFVGYRGHERSRIAPLFPFGHGLSYGTSDWSGAELSSSMVAHDGRLTVSLDVTNTGDRAVTDVVQIYATHPDPAMPAKTLVGFAKTELDPGGSSRIEVELGPVAWRRWDEGTSMWTFDPGPRELIIAASADPADEYARLPFEVLT